MGYFNTRSKTFLVVFILLLIFCLCTDKPWNYFWILLTSITALLFLVDLLFVSTNSIVFDPFYSNWESNMNSKKYA